MNNIKDKRKSPVKTALQNIADERLHKRCTSVTELNHFPNVYILNMDDGSECFARLALPVNRHSMVKAEVATIQYLAEHTSIPIPKIYTWDTNPENAVGAAYILFERTPGWSLGALWDNMKINQKEEVLRQIVDIMFQLFSLTFPKIGSLDRAADGDYIVGPLFHTSFLIDDTMDLDHGPWATFQDYLAATARRQLSQAEVKFPTNPEALELHNFYERIVRLIPEFSLKDVALERYALKLVDLGYGNFIIDGTRITSVMFWENAGTYPAWLCAEYPYWISKALDTKEWMSAEEIKENAKLRAFFHTEVAARDPLFLRALDEGKRYRGFEDKLTNNWEHYKILDGWIDKYLDDDELSSTDPDSEEDSSVDEEDSSADKEDKSVVS